jgi:acetyl-CoA carboxylase, biotin carboxylase subunit
MTTANIRRVFIANRGEIATRVIRTCKSLGIDTVLGASDADMASVPARLANAVVNVGPSHATQSYLNVARVVAAAREAGADAIHPGYGFLSENAALARSVRSEGLIFIGPTEANLEAVGDKLKARFHATAAGLPLAPGGSLDDPGQAAKLAAAIGYPVLVKAVGGGGGRGLKRVDAPEQLASTVELAMAEAAAAFGDARVYLERYVASGRHIEVQVMGDGVDAIHLGDRDCSVQRRYQKLVEEAPAPDLPVHAREGMRNAAVSFAKHLGYLGLGTVEFLYDRVREEFYFLEMNARIQVEHPVTEEITGIDLVAEQLWLAEGRRLRLHQHDISFNGHAIECRINAEDWRKGFQPSPGLVETAVYPAGSGIRVDTHIESGSTVPPFYDSLMAKLIVKGNDRSDAIQQTAAALRRCSITGVNHNRDMHLALMASDEFARGAVDTAFFPRWQEALP